MLQEGPGRGRRVVEHHAHHVGPVGRMRLLVVEAGEVGRLLLARDAPAGEEVDHDVVAAQCGQRDGAPVSRSMPVNAGACRPSSGLGDGGGLLGSPGGQHDADHDEDEEDGAGHPAGGVATAPAHGESRDAPRHERAHRLGRRVPLTWPLAAARPSPDPTRRTPGPWTGAATRGPARAGPPRR